jgi:hypothetical protein
VLGPREEELVVVEVDGAEVLIPGWHGLGLGHALTVRCAILNFPRVKPFFLAAISLEISREIKVSYKISSKIA